MGSVDERVLCEVEETKLLAFWLLLVISVVLSLKKSNKYSYPAQPKQVEILFAVYSRAQQWKMFFKFQALRPKALSVSVFTMQENPFLSIWHQSDQRERRKNQALKAV